MTLELPQGALVNETIGDIQACVIVTSRAPGSTVDVSFTLLSGTASK